MIIRILMKRLNSVKNGFHTIETSRIQGTSKEKLEKWFEVYRKEVDESGFSIGTIKAGRVIINSTLKSNYRAQPGRQEWVTVIECICANGTTLSSYVIFKGQTVDTKWIPDNIGPTVRVAAGANGWTSHTKGMDWMRTIFGPETKVKSGNLPRYRYIQPSQRIFVTICSKICRYSSGDITKG
jgi:hypothetical protein